MAYDNPDNIRSNEVKLRLSGPEKRVVDELVKLCGKQRATLLHDIVMTQVMKEIEIIRAKSSSWKAA